MEAIMPIFLYVLSVQLSELIAGVDREVLPALMTSLEPILPVLLAQQSNNLDLSQVINYVTQTVQKSTFHVGISSHLGTLDFLDVGKPDK